MIVSMVFGGRHIASLVMDIMVIVLVMPVIVLQHIFGDLTVLIVMRKVVIIAALLLSLPVRLWMI